ncbi:MAG: type 1 glutamine amidotransferase domain-containing protein [Alphaproteobacteria bacterium]
MTKVLIALTGAKEWLLKDGSTHFGGFWSPEFVYPHYHFTKAGYDITVATPGGVPAPVDPASLSLTIQENDQSSVDFQCAYLDRPEIKAVLAKPARLEALDADDFDVVFVPGGFGVFQDLGDTAVIGKLIAKTYRQEGKVVGTLCSGISSLLAARDDDGAWPFVGKRMTGFPNSEMIDFGVADGALWLSEDRLKALGADYRPGEKHTDVVIVDGNLVTGQNGASSTRTAKAVIDRVNAASAGRSFRSELPKAS